MYIYSNVSVSKFLFIIKFCLGAIARMWFRPWARGENGGMGDVNALGWRLAAVVNGTATPETLQGV